MLAAPGHLVPQMFGDGFQEYLLHPLSRDTGEADQPVVTCVFFLACLEDASDICFFPLFRNLS